MRPFGWLLVAVLLVGTSPRTRAQEEIPAAVKEVVLQFEQEAEEIDKKAEASARKWREKTAVELKKIQDMYCKDAKLDEAIAVRDLIRRMDTGAMVIGNDAPAAVKEVFKQYDAEFVAIQKKADGEFTKTRDKATAELKKIQDLYCKEAKLDEALAVREVIRSLRLGVASSLPDPGYVNNPATDIGKVFFYQTTGVATGGSIYGTDIYTTGSHLGMAAVHTGVLQVGQTGIVKVTILPGQMNYESSTKNGITSTGYSTWNTSFKVEKSYRAWGRYLGAARPDPGTLTGFRDKVGQTFIFEVTGSNLGSVWGTDIYTDDSNLATAAVHSGVLGVGVKGMVKVTVLGGQASYSASTRNGVSSGSWSTWTGSFRVDPVR